MLKGGMASIYGAQGAEGVILFRTRSAVQEEKDAAEARKAKK